MYKFLRATAYEPDPAHGPWVEHPHVLTFAQPWHAELTELYGRVKRRRGQPVALPVGRLNSLLSALAPGVVAIGRGASKEPELPWIYAREPVPADNLVPLMTTWAADLLHGLEDQEDEPDGACSAETRDDAERLLDAVWEGEPEWRATSLDLTASRLSAGGTAEPDHRLYSLLPEWVAARLAQRPFRIRDGELRFRIVNRPNCTELVSWPPLPHMAGRRTWYYSALIKITVHTVPFVPSPRVHVTTSIRRWATGDEARPKAPTGATVLLDAPLPWPDTGTVRARLIENVIGYDRRSKGMAWRRRSTVGLLPALDIVRTYPAPDTLLASPEDWLTGRNGVAAGIVHSNQMGAHKIGTGLMPEERSELDTWVEEGLRPLLRRVPDLTRVKQRIKPVKRPEGGPEWARARRRALRTALNGAPLDIEILWMTAETRDALLASLAGLLDLPVAEGASADAWEFRGSGLHVRLRTRPLGALGAPLKPVRGKAGRRAALGEAIRSRRDDTARQLDDVRSATAVALVELGGKSRFGAQDSDPKHAVRLGCARAGLLSQFITHPDDAETSLDHRADSAWLDVFRQLGALTFPGFDADATIPGSLQYLGLWWVRHNGKGPTLCAGERLVALRVRPEDSAHPVCGWDDAQGTWVPYSQLLLSLAAEAEPCPTSADEPAPSAVTRRFTHRSDRHDEAARQIRTILYDLRDRPTLLLANSGNLRQSWPGITNGSLVQDMINFVEGPHQRLASYGSDLRCVLVRDANGREEVPEWYAHDDEGRIGFTEGLRGPVDAQGRVFVSTAAKPKSGGKPPKGLRKLILTDSWPQAPTVTARNPAYLEVNVLGCLSEKALADAGRTDLAPDRPAEWAALVHLLRHHDDYPPLAGPLPLHLARLAGEYVLPLPVRPLEKPRTGRTPDACREDSSPTPSGDGKVHDATTDGAPCADDPAGSADAAP
ncbi:pPIWI_RE module domain-containing protein [Streptomyces pinistramenti]|uniref:pPIWI_RE module domain-containing protein n=1 Tax=Streptomyces pinistramenti TaxID=2884812 RepID=UPI001D05E11F|nr:DUF3962 domain-containing protein [Streptomyces pinistramenti]MCB5909655.1 DUF3962 domain-containing protein [Streptomyces pinistramenti]